MKRQGAAVRALLSDPPEGLPALLVHGADPMRVADARSRVLKAMLGPNAEEEMRLSRIEAADLRKDPAALIDAVKAQGFFPGPRAVHVEGATDGLAKPILAALEAHAPGDAVMVVTAAALPARSALRKAVEGHASAVAIALYDDPPTRAETEAAIREAGLSPDPDPDAAAMLADLALALPPGDFAQLLEKLALYSGGPVAATDVEAVAPASVEAQLDDALAVVADGRPDAIAPLLRRLEAQGTQPVSLAIAALRQFRTLHAVAVQGAGAVRPPLYGPRRDRAERQARAWGAERLERAMRLLVETDLELRSAGRSAPAMPVIERALVRLAVMGQR